MRNRHLVFIVLLSLLSWIPGGVIRCQEQRSVIYTAEAHYAKKEYALAVPLYLKLVEKRKVHPVLLRRLATCYAYLNAYKPAADWYAKLVASQGVEQTDWLYYGDMLKCLGLYGEAKSMYSHCLAGYVKELAVLHAAGADSARVWMQEPDSIRIGNMQEINTGYSDWGAVWYQARQIVFTSDSLRPSILDREDKLNRKNYGWTDRPYQKLYVIDSAGGSAGLTGLRGFARAMNRPEYHVGPVVFSSGNDTAYFTVTNPRRIHYAKETLSDKKKGSVVYYGTRRLELFYSVLDSNRQWQTPIAFAYNNADSFSIGHAALNPDGSILYFVSDMPGGWGKTDIWFVEKRSDGNWGAPQNCGPAINTPEEEEFPTMGRDGSLYFSSKGHPGMGGFDLFRSRGSRDQWTAAVNMRPPLNSSADDFCFVPRDSVSGLFSSNRPGGKGEDDIYRYFVQQTVPDSVLRDAPDTVKEQPGIPSRDHANDGNAANLKPVPDSLNGTPDNGTPEKVPPDWQIGAPDILKGIPDTMKLKNIYYDFDKWNIRADAAKALDPLIGLLKEHPGLQLEMSSYADARGSDGYNERLSEKRAESVRTYLLNHGIALGRIKSIGYGKTNPVNCCTTGVKCDEWKHQLNRRTEVKLIVKTKPN